MAVVAPALRTAVQMALHVGPKLALAGERLVADAAGKRSTYKIQDGCLDHQKCLHNYVEARRPGLEIVSER